MKSCYYLHDIAQVVLADFDNSLITGLSMKAKDSARMILKSVQSFTAQSPQYLKHINFIIFQDDMVSNFKQAVESFCKEKSSSMLGNAWSYVKGTVQGISLQKHAHAVYRDFFSCKN